MKFIKVLTSDILIIYSLGLNIKFVMLVTIAIPVYNAERYLRDAISSVLNQTYHDWELYLINDGSTDNSLDIMEEFVRRDIRIKLIDDGENKGLVYRLNQSILMATGKYYARMDADDIMFITRIEEQVKYLEAHPYIDVLGSSIMTIDNNNNIIGSGLSSGEVSSFIHPTVMGKLDWFKTYLYADWALRAEDVELWYRTVSTSLFWSMDKPLLFYREHGVPTTKKYIQTQKTLLKIFSRYKNYKKSFFWFITNSLSSIAKMILYMIFHLFDKTDFLVVRRHRVQLPKLKCLSREDLIVSIKQ